MEKTSVFRKESLDRVESPEQLDEYIKVSRPKVWMILTALLIAAAAVIIWSAIGTLPETMSVQGVTAGGKTVFCYENVEGANTNLEGCKVNISLPDGKKVSGVVKSVSQNPYSQEELRSKIQADWLADNVLNGNYAYEITVSAQEELKEDMLATVTITTAEIKPIQFILN